MKGITDMLAPTSIDEALSMLQEKGPAACILAGGTDVMVRLKRGIMPDTIRVLVSLHRVDAIRGVRVTDGTLVVGAATSTADLIRDPLVNEHAPILASVANRLASPQIRNLATIGGNLANASPAGDLINPLLLLDAMLVLAEQDASREVPVESFFTGPGQTVRHSEELLTEIRIPIPGKDRRFRFQKAGTRPAMECSVVTVGVAWTPEEGAAKDVRVAFGSSAPLPLRGRATEAVLEGVLLDPDSIERAAQAAQSEVTPISDIRGSADYRRALAGEFVRRLLDV